MSPLLYPTFLHTPVKLAGNPYLVDHIIVYAYTQKKCGDNNFKIILRPGGSGGYLNMKVDIILMKIAFVRACVPFTD